MIDSSSPIIDFHVHLYPPLPIPEEVKKVRTTLRRILNPITHYQHNIQSWLRNIPLGPRKLIHEMTVPSILPHLLLESNIEDLSEQTLKCNVAKVVIIPHPPIISNDFIFYECKKLPDKLIASTFIDPETLKSPEDLSAFYSRGVRIFKVNPLQSGVPASAPYYDKFLEFLNSKKAIVILHTGNIYSHVYKSPDSADASNYSHWFERYPNIQFLLAHMNLHEPEKAITLAEKYSNVYLLSSWQSSAIILKAVKKLGAHKLLFASDWPLLGNNIAHQKQIYLELYKKCLLSKEEVQKIFIENAKKLLNDQGLM